MSQDTTSGERLEERKDAGKGDAGLYAYWMMQEKIAEKEERNWVKKAREIVKRYRDERPQTGANANEHRFNILWSNIQTLKPVLYARTPKPDVQRRFLDQDPVGRLASILLERCIGYSLESNFDATMKAVVEDRLLPGRGVARVLYVPRFGEEIEDEAPKDKGDNETFENAEDAAAIVAGEGDKAKGAEAEDPKAKQAAGGAAPERLRRVDWEEVQSRYVFWEDYREGPARQWIEVPWVRYREYLTREQLRERFGKVKADKVQLDWTPKGTDEDKSSAPPPDAYKKAQIHETWDKIKKEVVWYAPGTPDLILDQEPDPLELQDFYPSPDPLLATTTNDKRIPVPDYLEYQDQARELDKLTQRIDKLTEALKVAGFYPGENKQEIQNLFDAGTENKLIPVMDWGMFSEKLGPTGFIVWVPIQQIAQTLIQLYNARDRVKALLYEVTGLSDILRGETVPSETLGAQQLKANFASRRIQPQQKDVAQFARDLVRLIGGVIAMHFSKETIAKITGYPQLKPVPPLPAKPLPPHPLLTQGPPASMGPGPAGPAAPPPPGAPAPGGPAPGGPPAAAPPPDPMMQAYQQALASWEQLASAVQTLQQENAQKQQAFDAAVALIKEDGPHGFRIDIETDSTIAPDEQQEQQARTELLQQLIPLLSQVIPIAQGNRAMAALARELVLFALRAFRVARQLEEVVEQAFDAIAQMAPDPKTAGEPQGKGSSPADMHAAAADAATKIHDIETKAELARAALAQKTIDAERDRQLKAGIAAGQEQLGRERLMLDIQKAGSENAHRDQIDMHRQTMEASRGLT